MRETRSQIQSRDKDMHIDDAPGMTCAKCGGKRQMGRACERNECAVKAFLSTNLYDNLLKEFDADLRALDVAKESDEMRIESSKEASEEKLELERPELVEPKLSSKAETQQHNDASKTSAAADEMEVEGASDKPIEAPKRDSGATSDAMDEFAELKAASPNRSPAPLKSAAAAKPPASKSSESTAVAGSADRKCMRLAPEVVANFLSDVEFTADDVFYNIDAAIGSFVFQVSAQTGARVIGLETDARLHALAVKMRERFVKAIPESAGVKIDVTLIHAHPFGELPKRILRGATVVFVNNLDYSVAKTRALLHFLEKHLEDDTRLITLKDLYQYSGEPIGPNHPMRIFAYPWKYHTVMASKPDRAEPEPTAHTYYIYVANRKQLKPLTNLSCGMSLRQPGDATHRLAGLNPSLRGSYVNTRFLGEVHAQTYLSEEYAFPGLLESFMLRAYGPATLPTESFATDSAPSTATNANNADTDQSLSADSVASLPARAISPQQAHEIRAGGSDASQPQALSVFAQEAVFRKSRYLVRQKREIEKLEIERQLNQQLQAQKELDRAVQLQAKQSNAELKLLKQQAQQAAQQEAAAKQQAQQAHAQQQQQEQHALLYSHLYPQFPLSPYPHQVSSYTTAMNQSYSQYSHLQHMQQSQHMQAPNMPHSLTHLHLAPQGTTQQQQQAQQAHVQAAQQQAQSAQAQQQQQVVQQQQQAQQQAVQQQAQAGQAGGQANSAQAQQQAQQAQQSALQYAQLMQLQPGVNQFAVPSGVGLPAPYGPPSVQGYGQYPGQAYPAQYGVGGVQMGQLSVGQYPHPSQYPVVGYPPAQAYTTGLPPYGSPSVVGAQVGYPPAQAYGQYPAPYGAVPPYTQPQQQQSATANPTQPPNATAPTSGQSLPSPANSLASGGATALQATSGAPTNNATTPSTQGTTAQSNATGTTTNAKPTLATATSGAKGKGSNANNSNAIQQQHSLQGSTRSSTASIDAASGATAKPGSHAIGLAGHPASNATNTTANTTSTSPPPKPNSNTSTPQSATNATQQQQQQAQFQAQQQAGMQMLSMAHGAHVSPLTVTDANLSFLHQTYLTQQQMYQQQQQMLQHSLMQQQQQQQQLSQAVDSHGQPIGATQSNATSSTHRDSQSSHQPPAKSATTKSNRGHARASPSHAQPAHNSTATQQQATGHAPQPSIAQAQSVSQPLQQQQVVHQQLPLPPPQQQTTASSHASHDEHHNPAALAQMHAPHVPLQHTHALHQPTTADFEPQLKQQQLLHQPQHSVASFPSGQPSLSLGEAFPGAAMTSVAVTADQAASLADASLAQQDYTPRPGLVHWDKSQPQAASFGNNFSHNNHSNSGNVSAVTGGGAQAHKAGSSTLVIRGGLAGSLARSTESESKRKASVGELDASSLAPSTTQAAQQPASSKRIKLSVSSESLHASTAHQPIASGDASAFPGLDFHEPPVEGMAVEGDANATQHANANKTISLSLSGAKKPADQQADQSAQGGNANNANQPKSNAIKIRIVK